MDIETKNIYFRDSDTWSAATFFVPARLHGSAARRNLFRPRPLSCSFPFLYLAAHFSLLNMRREHPKNRNCALPVYILCSASLSASTSKARRRRIYSCCLRHPFFSLSCSRASTGTRQHVRTWPPPLVFSLSLFLPITYSFFLSMLFLPSLSTLFPQAPCFQ